MILGVTGSRIARPQKTLERLYAFLNDNQVTELHHGDCIGWDQQCHDICAAHGIKTVAHPPNDQRYRAGCAADVILPEKPYLERNKDIVRASGFLIAAPDGPERLRSGTWSTVRYAKNVNVGGVVWL